MSATASPPDGKPARLPRWTNNLLVLALGVSAALLTLELLPRDAPPLPASPGAAPGGSASTAPDPLQLGQRIVATHLFGNVESAPAPAPEPVRQVAEPTRLNLQLAGVFAADPQSQAIAIISTGSAEQNAYGVGDRISGETTLKAVYRGPRDHRQPRARRAALVARQRAAAGDERRCPARPIRRGAAAGRRTSASPSPCRPTPARFATRWRETRRCSVAWSPPSPTSENGKLVGYRITPKQNPEILEAQGIVAGDVITRVNDIQLNSQKQGIRALRNAVKAQNLEVVVLRDGIEVPISISLAQ